MALFKWGAKRITKPGFPLASTLPHDSAERKKIPLFGGVFKYFPAALAAVAKVSRFGNDKHNPGKPLHWSRGPRGNDHEEALLRHLMDLADGQMFDEDSGLPIAAHLAWRALAIAQMLLEEQGAPAAPASAPQEDVE